MSKFWFIWPLRQWSSSADRAKYAATHRVYPTGVAQTQHSMATTAYWLSSQMPIKNPFCHLLEPWKHMVIVITKSTFTVLMEPATHLQSSFSAISPISLSISLCHATRNCRYGTDRIGLTVRKVIAVAKHALMCMRGTLKARHVLFRLIWNN